MDSKSRSVKGNICRACHSFCPVHIDIKNGKTIALKPVKDHPVYHGYACAKGRASPEFAYQEGRLLSSLKRQADGSHQPIASDQAIREVAAIIQQTIERYGPRSVAIYTGTFGSIYPITMMFSDSFMDAISSPMKFGSMAIDQPGKAIALALHGMWLAGHANIDQADAWLVIGTNPAISMLGPPNPAYVINRAKERGCKIFVIDPRRTEIAQQADVFLQVPPGQDSAILAGLIHIILTEKLQDQAFLDDNARGLDTLKKAISNFTPEFVAKRVGVSIEQLQAVARSYAGSKSGVVFAGTGPNMSPHGTLTEYLRTSLMTICGHWRRAGDAVPAHGVLVHMPPALAQATDPTPGWGLGQQMRVRNLTNNACGMPTAALAEEILLEGEGQVRVLIVNGGNPMAAWPDQLRTQEAMKKLDLLVCLEPVMSDTAKYADYVIAPKVQYENIATSAVFETFFVVVPSTSSGVPYAAYAPALVDPPPGADVIEDWEFFYGLAREMGLLLTLYPLSFAFDPVEAKKRAVQLDMNHKPTSEDVWELLLAGSPVSLEEVKAHPTGKIFDVPEAKVLPKAMGWTGKLDIGNADMMEDLQRAYDDLSESETREFDFRVVGRRLKDRHNSAWREHTLSTRKWLYNPAFMNPNDLTALGLGEGDIVEIRSRRGAIKGVVEVEKTMLAGVIAMTHCWGGNPEEDADPLTRGANTGLLTDNTVDYDPYSAIPRMSAIPVNIKLIEKRSRAAK